jgi:RimJ/RimL family protein N-acetyltransferase
MRSLQGEEQLGIFAAPGVEIGWGLNDSACGKGYATEVAAAVLEWAFQQHGVRPVSATIPGDNPASEHVAHRLGLTRTGDTRRNLPLWKRER